MLLRVGWLDRGEEDEIGQITLRALGGGSVEPGHVVNLTAIRLITALPLVKSDRRQLNFDGVAASLDDDVEVCAPVRS